jgi:shikimate dehydrogenase
MMNDTYALMGNPVTHSHSPFIHTEFAKQTHQDMTYIKMEIPLDQFEEQVRLFVKQQGKGLNITIPFKQRAYHLVNKLSSQAAVAKAVNTIQILPNGQLYGDNTDGMGFIRDITLNQNYNLKDKNILILGAGGATRGILQPTIEQAPKKITLANRTFSQAQQLEFEFKSSGLIQAVELEALDEPVDLVINAARLESPAKIALNTSILSATTFCYDLMYGHELTPFLKWAILNGNTQIADGTGMLVEQAALSFFIWRGVKPDTKRVIKLLKHHGIS